MMMQGKPGAAADTLFPEAGKEQLSGLQALLTKIDEVFPLSPKHHAGLPKDVAELSRQLTSGRGDRVDGYLGKAAGLSAYLRYFLPWNIYRLSRLLPSLDIILRDGDVISDLGSGPMTFALALWMSRPELRKVKLEIRCLDRTAHALEAGKKLFYSYAGETCPWAIRPIRGPLGTAIYGKPAALVTAINVYNELFWNAKTGLETIVQREADYLLSLAGKDGSILLMEPGIPRSGEFISLIRGYFLSASAVSISAPCPHREACPFPGGKRGSKWCHFAFHSGDAPRALQTLSRAAGIPKERAVLSFLFMHMKDNPRAPAQPEHNAGARIISDAIGLDNARAAGEAEYGRYACSARGMVLVAGKRESIENISPGTLIELAEKTKRKNDPKTGIPVFGI